MASTLITLAHCDAVRRGHPRHQQSLDTGRNIATSILFLVLILQEQSLGAVLVGYGLSVPYNIVATVGVWRSAARYGGPSLYANLARIVTVTLMAGLTLT